MDTETSRFIGQCLSYISSFALRCAADLGISDIIHAYGEPMPLKELARSIPIPAEKEPMLGQIMQLLVHQRVFAQSEIGYMLTPFSKLMLTKGDAMSSYVRFMTETMVVEPWFRVSEWFKASDHPDPMYNMAHDGQSFWGTTKERPEINRVFNEAMASLSRKFMTHLVTNQREVFDGLKSLVDVGGGTGMTLKYIADAFPSLKCTVFDLPQVIANAPKCEAFDAVGGSMFEKIPSANAVLIKNVLHDWSEEDCVKILNRCREAVPPAKDGGKIIVMEIIVNLEDEDRGATETNLLFDLFMMCKHNAKVYTLQEWKKIFHAAGFTDYKILPVKAGFSIIELYP